MNIMSEMKMRRSCDLLSRKVKTFTITLSEGERNHISSCLGIAARQIMQENFLRGESISNQLTDEWLKLQRRFEFLVCDSSEEKEIYK